MEMLTFHPAHPPLSVSAVRAALIFPRPGVAMARYRVEGIDTLVTPAFTGRGRQDELWRTTCFELFMHTGETAYREFNFCPSGRWAAYDFDGYRQGMRDCELETIPEVDVRSGDMLMTVNVTLSDADLAERGAVALCAVIEETGGHKSYWALAHGGAEPDFHDPACFTLALDAAA